MIWDIDYYKTQNKNIANERIWIHNTIILVQKTLIT